MRIEEGPAKRVNSFRTLSPLLPSCTHSTLVFLLKSLPVRLLEKERGKEERKEIPRGISNAVKKLGKAAAADSISGLWGRRRRGKFLRPGKKGDAFCY